MAGFERAAQEYEQAAHGEVHVAVAQATEMSRVDMLARVSALHHRGEQSWTSPQVMSLDQMNSVAGDALEKIRRILMSEASAAL